VRDFKAIEASLRTLCEAKSTVGGAMAASLLGLWGWHTYRWARYCVQSRTYTYGLGMDDLFLCDGVRGMLPTALVPLGDMVNHGFDGGRVCDTDWVGNASAAGAATGAQGTGAGAVPGCWRMLLNRDRGAYVLRTSRRMRAGEEVLISYGDRAARDCLESYGFLPGCAGGSGGCGGAMRSLNPTEMVSVSLRRVLRPALRCPSEGGGDSGEGAELPWLDDSSDGSVDEDAASAGVFGGADEASTEAGPACRRKDMDRIAADLFEACLQEDPAVPVKEAASARSFRRRLLEEEGFVDALELLDPRPAEEEPGATKKRSKMPSFDVSATDDGAADMCDGHSGSDTSAAFPADVMRLLRILVLRAADVPSALRKAGVDSTRAVATATREPMCSVFFDPLPADPSASAGASNEARALRLLGALVSTEIAGSVDFQDVCSSHIRRPIGEFLAAPFGQQASWLRLAIAELDARFDNIPLTDAETEPRVDEAALLPWVAGSAPDLRVDESKKLHCWSPSLQDLRARQGVAKSYRHIRFGVLLAYLDALQAVFEK
jgi:hypothetical protein